MKNLVTKDIKISKHNYILEIYMDLEGHKDITWEIFASDYSGCLYAFSNKNRIENIINKKYIFEPIKERK